MVFYRIELIQNSQRIISTSLQVVMGESGGIKRETDRQTDRDRDRHIEKKERERERQTDRQT